MRMPRSTRRRSAVLLLLLAVLVGPFLAWQAATGGEKLPESTLAPRGIVVVGDSITARYNDKPGDVRQGWWSLVADHFGAKVTTYAESGSGYLRPGRNSLHEPCRGNTFIDRYGAYDGPSPSLFIIEGGRNDWSICDHDHYVKAPDHLIKRAVNRYYDALQTYLPSSTRIIVMGPPWGPFNPADCARVTDIIEAAAKAHHLEFIATTGTLTEQRVFDGVHPNRAGSLAIAARVIRALEVRLPTTKVSR